jgi:hypothetical protein
MEHQLFNFLYIYHLIIQIGKNYFTKYFFLSNKIYSYRLYVQENSGQIMSSNDDIGSLDDENPQLFRRMGIIAAFDSLERAKKLV